MSVMTNCPECGSDEIETSTSAGIITCVMCGCVLSHTVVAQDVEFVELSSGRTVALGQTVSKHGDTGATGTLGRFISTREIAREKSLYKVKAMAGAVSHKLHISSQVEDYAMEKFDEFSRKGYTKGRKLNHFVSVCLYISCRTFKTPHMLLDFSELLRTDINGLYRLLLTLTKYESLTFPIDDPSIYCTRFAEQMRVGSNLWLVTTSAVKIIRAMQVNWIAVGRKPAGLCAAALLVACRIHGINRSYADMARIIGIRPETVEKRLCEFNETDFGDWTVEQFKNCPEIKDGELNSSINATIPQFKTQDKEKSDKMFKISSNVMEIGAQLDQLIQEEGFWSPSVQLTPTLKTSDLGLNESVEELMSFKPLVEEIVEEAEFNLEDVDDEEIEEIMNSPGEIEVKQEMWDLEYADFVKELERKREERERAKLANSVGVNSRRKRKNNTKRNTPISEMSFETTAQAIQEAVRRKKLPMSCIEGLENFSLPKVIKENDEEYPVLNDMPVMSEVKGGVKDEVKCEDFEDCFNDDDYWAEAGNDYDGF